MSSLYQTSSSAHGRHSHALSSFPAALSSSPAPPPPSSSSAIAAYGSHNSSSFFSSHPSHFLTPDPSFSSDKWLNPLPSYPSSLSPWNPSSSSASWLSATALQLSDPLLSSLKRPADEVIYAADIVPKRARVDSLPSLPVYPQRSGEKDCAFYMRTRTCSFGASCKYNHPTWVPAGGIPDWKEASAPTLKSATLPVRPGELDCAFYMKTGICKYGLKCKFNHPEDRTAASDKKPLDEVKPESVKGASEVAAMGMPANDTAAENIVASAANGADGDANAPIKLVAPCNAKDSDANAPIKLATAYNVKGLPIRPGETECAFYMKTGSCKYGSTCRFNHPDKMAASVAVQSQPTVAFGYPSMHAGALSDYGLSIPGLGFGVSALTQTPPYPQRPGENTCSYYMKTGICKFGSTCKFHHPVNRTEPSNGDPNVKLTLAGLPRHEGARSCPYYMKTGSCKYGMACKFDHPPPGEAAAMALAEAGKSEENKLTDDDS